MFYRKLIVNSRGKWKREKDLERECVQAREMKAGPRV